MTLADGTIGWRPSSAKSFGSCDAITVDFGRNERSQKSCGLVCTGEQVDLVTGFEFVMASQADHTETMLCEM